MKGVKCKNLKTSHLRILLLCLSLFFLSVFGVLLHSNSVSAASLGTYQFNLNWQNSSFSNPQTSSLGFNQQVGGVYRAFWFETQFSDINATGNNAVIHAETNIVARSGQGSYRNGSFVNRDYYQVTGCWSSAGGAYMSSGSVSSIGTYWTNSNNELMETLTLYFDIAITNITQGTQHFTCGFNNSTGGAFFQGTDAGSLRANLYFEQNPASITFTNNETDSLLRAQIQQTQALINSSDAVNDSVNSQGQAITNAINNQSANEKSEYQSQATQNEQTIDSDVANNETQAVTLINVLTTVLSTIKNTGAGSCGMYLPSDLVNASSQTRIDLCPSGYTTFINTSFGVFGALGFSISNVIRNVVMIFVYCSIVISILVALKKLYNMFLGGNNG